MYASKKSNTFGNNTIFAIIPAFDDIIKGDIKKSPNNGRYIGDFLILKNKIIYREYKIDPHGNYPQPPEFRASIISILDNSFNTSIIHQLYGIDTFSSNDIEILATYNYDTHKCLYYGNNAGSNSGKKRNNIDRNEKSLLDFIQSQSKTVMTITDRNKLKTFGLITIINAYVSLKINKATLEQEIKQLKELNSSYSLTFEDNDKQISKLENKCDNYAVSHNRLREKNEKLREENRRVKEENESLREENESLIEENQRIIEENERVIEENKRVKEENKSLIEKNESLKEENKRVKEENKKFIEKNESLKEIFTESNF